VDHATDPPLSPPSYHPRRLTASRRRVAWCRRPPRGNAAARGNERAVAFGFGLNEVHAIAFGFGLNEVHAIAFGFGLNEVHAVTFGFGLNEVHAIAFGFGLNEGPPGARR